MNPSGRRRRPAAGMSLLVVMLLAAAPGACGGSGGDPGASIRLQPATVPGPDPFSKSVAVGTPARFRDQAATLAASTTTTSSPVDRSARTPLATGTAPRLYGGTGDSRVCDPGKLVEFLESHRGEAAAWSKTLGIDRGRIERYVDGLTPVLLTTDTRVTNHGYRDGGPTSFQAVLQAGTAVMVDARGVPRVKCNCGNPLTPPEALAVADARVVGARWPRYDPRGVITVRPGVPVDSFTLVNIENGHDYTVPVGGAPSESVAGDALRKVDWKNRSYGRFGNGDCPDATLTDGRAVSPDGDMGIRLAKVQYGDLTGDGVEEALVTLECFAVGGNAYPAVISLAFASGPDGPTRLGDEIVGVSPAMVSGTVRTSDPVWAPNDPRCCPSSTNDQTWRFVDGNWVASATAPGDQATSPASRSGTTPGGGTASAGPCTAAAVQAAVSASGSPSLRVVGVAACDGAWAAPALAFPDGDETSALLRWNGRAWERAGCADYQNPSDWSTPRPGTVPLSIFRAGCASN